MDHLKRFSKNPQQPRGFLPSVTLIRDDIKMQSVLDKYANATIINGKITTI